MSLELNEGKKLKFLIIDDHELLLNGTVEAFKKRYPLTETATASTAEMALFELEKIKPDLIVVDLSLPEKAGTPAKTEVGLELIKKIMSKYPDFNIIVQSTYIKALVRIIPEIENHKGGFTVAEKSFTSGEFFKRVEWALQGLTYTKDIKGKLQGLELKQEWQTVLSLAFEEGLQDKAIAQKMCVSERMVRHYWTKIQDILRVYPEEGKNIRIQTEMRAREEGIID